MQNVVKVLRIFLRCKVKIAKNVNNCTLTILRKNPKILRRTVVKTVKNLNTAKCKLFELQKNLKLQDVNTKLRNVKSELREKKNRND